MEDYTKKFNQHIEVPDVVKKQAEDAFSRIKTEGQVVMKDKSNKNGIKSLFSNRVAVVAGIVILATGSITAVAAMSHAWDRGLKGLLFSSDEQQQTLAEQGVAVIMSEQDKYADMAVTVGGITVTPETVVADDQFMYLSFSVKGYELEQGLQPFFEYTYMDEEQSLESGKQFMNWYGGFYDGMMPDQNGRPVYEDGLQPIYDENGRIIEHYIDEDGLMHFTFEAHVLDKDDSFLGKTIHVKFQNIGTVNNCDYKNYMDGEWSFVFDIENEKSTQKVAVNQEVKGTGFTIDTIEITPVSIRLNYSVTSEVVIQEDVNEIPLFRGVVLKDGTRLPYLFNGGTSGYTDETMEHAYMMSGFERVIEISEIQSLLLVKDGTNDLLEVPIQ